MTLQGGPGRPGKAPPLCKRVTRGAVPAWLLSTLQKASGLVNLGCSNRPPTSPPSRTWWLTSHRTSYVTTLEQEGRAQAPGGRPPAFTVLPAERRGQLSRNPAKGARSIPAGATLRTSSNPNRILKAPFLIPSSRRRRFRRASWRDTNSQSIIPPSRRVTSLTPPAFGSQPKCQCHRSFLGLFMVGDHPLCKSAVPRLFPSQDILQLTTYIVYYLSSHLTLGCDLQHACPLCPVQAQDQSSHPVSKWI